LANFALVFQLGLLLVLELAVDDALPEADLPVELVQPQPAQDLVGSRRRFAFSVHVQKNERQALLPRLEVRIVLHVNAMELAEELLANEVAQLLQPVLRARLLSLLLLLRLLHPRRGLGLRVLRSVSSRLGLSCCLCGCRLGVSRLGRAPRQIGVNARSVFRLRHFRLRSLPFPRRLGIIVILLVIDVNVLIDPGLAVFALSSLALLAVLGRAAPAARAAAPAARAAAPAARAAAPAARTAAGCADRAVRFLLTGFGFLGCGGLLGANKSSQNRLDRGIRQAFQGAVQLLFGHIELHDVIAHCKKQHIIPIRIMLNIPSINPLAVRCLWEARRAILVMWRTLANANTTC
jgi:hypothetical protein